MPTARGIASTPCPTRATGRAGGLAATTAPATAGRGAGSGGGGTYGSSNAPVNPGSSGSGTGGDTGRAGGGLAWVKVAGNVTLNGKISANGGTDGTTGGDRAAASTWRANGSRAPARSAPTVRTRGRTRGAAAGAAAGPDRDLARSRLRYVRRGRFHLGGHRGAVPAAVTGTVFYGESAAHRHDHHRSVMVWWWSGGSATRRRGGARRRPPPSVSWWTGAPRTVRGNRKGVSVAPRRSRRPSGWALTPARGRAG